MDFTKTSVVCCYYQQRTHCQGQTELLFVPGVNGQIFPLPSLFTQPALGSAPVSCRLWVRKQHRKAMLGRVVGRGRIKYRGKSRYSPNLCLPGGPSKGRKQCPGFIIKRNQPATPHKRSFYLADRASCCKLSSVESVPVQQFELYSSSFLVST